MSASHEGIEPFWQWLLEHQAGLESLSTPGSIFRTEFSGHLHQIHSGLSWELALPVNGKPSEVVITAGSHAELFPLVDALVAAAPPVPGWKFTPLKPAFGFSFTTTHNGTRFEPQAMWFLVLEDQSSPGKLAIRVAIPNFTSTTPTQAKAAVAIVLEKALGERSLGTDIASFEVTQTPRDLGSGGYMELFELPDVIDERKRATG